MFDPARVDPDLRAPRDFVAPDEPIWRNQRACLELESLRLRIDDDCQSWLFYNGGSPPERPGSDTLTAREDDIILFYGTLAYRNVALRAAFKSGSRDAIHVAITQETCFDHDDLLEEVRNSLPIESQLLRKLQGMIRDAFWAVRTLDEHYAEAA